MYGLSVVSFLTGLAAVLVFGYVSNQESLRRIKDRIQAHLLELRLFPDQLGVVLKAYGRVLRWTLAYLTYNLKPLAILMLPLVIIMVQLDLRLGSRPFQPHDSFILTAKLAEPGALDSGSLQTAEGVDIDCSSRKHSRSPGSGLANSRGRIRRIHAKCGCGGQVVCKAGGCVKGDNSFGFRARAGRYNGMVYESG